MAVVSTRLRTRFRPGARKVFCVKFQKEMEGLDEVPFEGHPLGQKIYENVSKEAWKMWVEHMKMLMNEYRLNLGTSEAQEFLHPADGQLLLRRRRGAAARFRAAQDEGLNVSSASQCWNRSSRVRPAQRRFHLVRRYRRARR